VATANASVLGVSKDTIAAGPTRAATSSKAADLHLPSAQGGKFLPFAALFFSPLLNLSVIPLKQYLGYLPPFVLTWPGVLRILSLSWLTI